MKNNVWKKMKTKQKKQYFKKAREKQRGGGEKQKKKKERRDETGENQTACEHSFKNMKKTIILASTILFIFNISLAQIGSTQKTISKAQQFNEQKGTFIKEKNYNIGYVNRM